MSLTVAELQPTLHDLFHDTARLHARDSLFCRRQRLLTGPVFAQALVFSLLRKPNSSLEDFADFAAEYLDVHVTPKAFEERFTQYAADFLRRLLHDAFQHCFTPDPALLPLLRRFNGTYVRDATLVSLPDSLAEYFPGRKGPSGKLSAALKLVLEVEVSSGEFTAAEVLPGRDNEKTAALSSQPLPAGALLLEDMGFLAGDRLEHYDGQGVYFLTRVPAGTAFYERRGRRLERLDLLKCLRRAEGNRLEKTVHVFRRNKLELRLLAVRVPAEVAEERRRQVRQDAKKRGRPVSQRKLDLCDWNILLTNAPRELLGLGNAAAVRRVRWQIELVFKLFKSEGGLERTQARNRWRVLTELYGKLLAMVVQQWSLLAAGYVLLQALGSAAAWGRQVELLRRRVQRCPIQKRTKQPSTFDRLEALDDEFARLDAAA
jgi:Transposase DDE domain